ncbi:hypothetical protein [Tichowtungia aerotolerans]|uniref:Subtilase-type serine protease n=1 Tax=Tichowtungia aerotolerans TaxID=2697043 RepID=A0A6P1M283_9BACT|nr:hypothetical protein [Tichowtungia aerotolerans]QHI68939.1 hypothetical protein GT409_05575 [Tichowtungia aerotolerans]
MAKRFLSLVAGLCILLAADAGAQASRDAYIGYVYPAGGQQGTMVPVRIGGQRIESVCGALVSGEGVTVKVIDCLRRMNNNDMRLMKEQLQLIREEESAADEEVREIADRIQQRIDEDQRQPASQSLATVVLLEVTIDKNALPGRREIRLLTSRGASNPLSFYVGRLPETSRRAMKISKFQTLGKEHLAQRNRPPEEEEKTISLPCTVNGQIASGEINRYRFQAHKGDRLVITTLARQLVPYIADAVPGWFQPVMTLRNAAGKEMAFNDDFRFKPDPTLLYEVLETDEYILSIHDSIYRGREDFVYRITIGQLPFITSVFPPGGTAGSEFRPTLTGWNLGLAKLRSPGTEAGPGIHYVAADRGDALSNYIPFALDTLPECEEQKNPIAGAQKVDLPIIINGRIEKPGDKDVYRFSVDKSCMVVAEVNARRLDSPLDSIIYLTDDNDQIIAFNDDHSDPGSGLNTHHADSYLRIKLPAAGTYRLHLTDTARQGGDAYTYRLRLSPPQPDFALRTVPSKITVQKNAGSLEVFIIRKDGFDGSVMLDLDSADKEILGMPVLIAPEDEKVRFSIKTTKKNWDGPVAVNIIGTATINGDKRVRRAVPAEDWMQAFLWRHLVPAQELLAYHYAPSTEDEIPLPDKPDLTDLEKGFNKKSRQEKQVVSRIKQIGRLYQERLLTEDLYSKTVEGLLDYEEEKE